MNLLKRQGKFLATQETWQQVEEGMYALVGSPATVRDKLSYWQRELGAGNILIGFQIGDLSHEQTRRSMRLFAEEVMPKMKSGVEK
jgi:alkanesulfonate monooxygenase SsuD/methylene tetrahydromethanopterin reductase-like flavin-dependent oxidoreductase (luciferase family)